MIDKEILNKSIDYILQHLQEKLTVQEVANHFHFSEYYFNREFQKMTGESVYSFIKRQRLNQSAMEIKGNLDVSITDIGEKYGYSSSNYSSAFKKIKDISPAEFRKRVNKTSSNNPFIEEKIEYFDTYETYDEKISVQEVEDIRVLYERFIGNYSDLKEAWYDFMDMHSKELSLGGIMIERFYDDPKVVEVNKCICDLCMSINESYKGDNVTIIKGGRFAVYRYEGKIGEIYRTLQGIFSIWLPQSPYKMEERYGINIYRSVDKKQDIVKMDLCIPIK